MEHPPAGSNHLTSPPYAQPYHPVQQPYGRGEQEYSGYQQKVSDPYYSSQRSSSTTPIYPTPLPALIEPGQNFASGSQDGPKLSGQQFGMTSPAYGRGSTEMGPMMRALTEDDMFMPQPPEYRSPMQSVSTSYGQTMGYTSPDGSRGAYGSGQYPSPFSPGHSPRTSQIYPMRGHPMSPHDSSFASSASQFHRQTSQSPHMNMVSPTGQNSVFNRASGVTAPSPVGMQGQSMYSHSPGSSQGGRSNSHFPFCTSPGSQHTSPLPSPSSLRSPGVTHSPHNLATTPPGPFNNPSNPSPVNVPRPIKSPVAAFQTPAAVTQSGHPLMSKVRPVDNGDKSFGGTPYVELVHTRNDLQNKSHATTREGSPDNPYPKKKEDKCSSGSLPKLEEMVAFLGESTTKGILTPKDNGTPDENSDGVSKDKNTEVNRHSEGVKSNGERHPPSGMVHTGSVESAQRQDISDAKQEIIIQETNRCSRGNGSPSPGDHKFTKGDMRGGSPITHRANGDVSDRNLSMTRHRERSPKGGHSKQNAFRNQNGPVNDSICPTLAMNSSLDSMGRRTQSPQSLKVGNDILQVDKNSMSVNNQLKRKFSESRNDIYHNNAFSDYPRNGGQSVTAYPLTYTPTNGNGKDQYRPNSPRGSKSPGRKSKEDFGEGNSRKVLKTYSGKKKRTSVDKQGNAIVLPSPLLPLSMTDPPKPKEEKQSDPEEPVLNDQTKDTPVESPQTSTTETTTASRSVTPSFQNPMTTPSSQRSTPDKPVTPNSQDARPSTPVSQITTEEPTTPNSSSKKRGRPVGSKNRPKKEGEVSKPRKKPVKKTFELSLDEKDELGKFKHVKQLVKTRNADSPQPLKAAIRGPVLRFSGTRSDPISSKVVNNPDALAATANAPVKKRGQKASKVTGKSSNVVSRAPLGPATKHSSSVNNPGGPWLCVLCGKPANHDSLGDLYGPYYPPGYQIPAPTPNPQSTTGKAKSAVAAAATKKQLQQARSRQKGKLKATSPPPQATLTTKATRGKASCVNANARTHKYSTDAEYLMLLDQPTTSSGRVSKTPKRMTLEIQKLRITPKSGGGRKRKTSEHEDRGKRKTIELADRGLCDPNEYWVHEDCVIWTQGVYVVGGTLYGLAEATKATQSVECVECKDKGASLGCLSKGCKKTYHYVCAVQADCQLQVDNYSMICPQHKDKVVKMKDLT
ncbi:uncharacterized protein [Asterias amurensis]|uniref:uncharacterized protein n=1 Tax=Asterias amurensis TaxID=7602 RepID=UPI003AB663E8